MGISIQSHALLFRERLQAPSARRAARCPAARASLVIPLPRAAFERHMPLLSRQPRPPAQAHREFKSGISTLSCVLPRSLYTHIHPPPPLRY